LRPALNNDRIKQANERVNAMEQKDKRKEILIVILVLVAVIDLVLFALYLNRNTAVSFSDVGIWVGSLGSIAAFIAVIFTTQKQLKSQRKSLKKQLEAQKKNLQEQIDNQNKQMHRPFLYIKFIKRVNETGEKIYRKMTTHKRTLQKYKADGVKFPSGALCCIPNVNTPHSIPLEITLRNDGVGIASNICLFDCNSERMVSIHTYDECTEGTLEKGSKIINIPNGKKMEILILLDVEDLSCENIEKPIICTSDSIIIYSDLNGNIYKSNFSLLILKENNDYNISFGEFPEGNITYKYLLKKNKLSEEHLDKKYLNFIAGE